MKKIVTMLLAAALLTGCAAQIPSGIDPAFHASGAADLGMLGHWKSARGTEVVITHMGGAAFEMDVTDGSTSAVYRGHLLAVGGARFAEVSVFQPEGSREIPVYVYALVELSGDSMVHKPLRAEWLAQESSRLPGAIYHSTAQEQPGSGGVVVRDRGAMLELLRKAASDPAAFGPGETLQRVHAK